MSVAFIYVQHLLGIGHLVRACSIAEALADAGFAVQLVSGGMAASGRVPRNVNVLQLPPIYAADATLKPLRGANGDPIDDDYKARRRDVLLAAFDAASPDVVVTEAYPFGRRALRFELEPLMERIAATRPRPVVVASVRDILQIRRSPEREHEHLETANRWFDAVLVHGDPRFARFEETFPLAAQLRPEVHYTGFVLARNESPREGRACERREVVVSAGGGAVGMELLEAALAARSYSRFRDLQWRILVGTNVYDGDFLSLRREADLAVVVERARDDFGALLRDAFVSVSRAGYNTVLDVCASGARGVFVPFTASGETEQRTRARRVRELGLGIVVDDGDLEPRTLAAAIDEAGIREHWGRWTFATDGAARSAERIGALIRSRMSHAETQT